MRTVGSTVDRAINVTSGHNVRLTVQGRLPNELLRSVLRVVLLVYRSPASFLGNRGAVSSPHSVRVSLASSHRRHVRLTPLGLAPKVLAVGWKIQTSQTTTAKIRASVSPFPVDWHRPCRLSPCHEFSVKFVASGPARELAKLPSCKCASHSGRRVGPEFETIPPFEYSPGQQTLSNVYLGRHTHELRFRFLRSAVHIWFALLRRSFPVDRIGTAKFRRSFALRIFRRNYASRWSSSILIVVILESKYGNC